MYSILVWMVGAAGVAAGPGLLTVAEWAAGASLVTVARARFVVAAAMSAMTALLWWAGWAQLGMTPAWLAWCWACALGCSLVLTDVCCRRLPFRLLGALAGGGALVFLCAALIDGVWTQFGFACTAAVAVFALAGLAQISVPGHTGGGDTALYSALALYLGWFGWDGLLRGLLISCGLTGIVALAVAASSKSMNSRFPAGPSLLAGALASILIT